MSGSSGEWKGVGMVNNAITIPDGNVRLSFPFADGRRVEMFLPPTMTDQEWSRLATAIVSLKGTVVAEESGERE